MEAVISERVRYHETDAGGGAGERAFVYWFDAARSAVFRAFSGLEEDLKSGETAVKTDELYYSVVFMERPRYDEAVKIQASFSLSESGGVRFDYKVFSDSDGTLIAKGYSLHSFYRGDVKIDQSEIRDLLKVR